MPSCPYCGCYVSANAKFCPSCGSRTGSHPPKTEPQENPGRWYAAETLPQPLSQEEYCDPGPGVREVYARVLALLREKPLRLWGASLLYLLLTALACGLSMLPIISIPLVFALSVGMESIYLEALCGAAPEPRHLFKAFTKSGFIRFVCGMGWAALWLLIWSLIPIAGPFIAVAKSYSYRFVPYIMLSDPEVDAFRALERSKEMSRGFRGRMFLSELFLALALLLITAVLVLLSALHIIGFVFALALVLLALASAALLPMILGLMRATWYSQIEKML